MNCKKKIESTPYGVCKIHNRKISKENQKFEVYPISDSVKKNRTIIQ